MNTSGFAAGLLVGAFLITQGPTEKESAIALAQAEAQWKARGPKSYSFEIALTCFCSLKGMNFRVIDGQAEVPRGATEVSRRFHESYGTVELIFTKIRRAIAEGAYRIKVKYDGELGYPVWFDLDPRKEVIDDELFLRVTGFQPRWADRSRAPRTGQAAAFQRRLAASSTPGSH